MPLPLPIPSTPWENVSMENVRGLPMSRKGHDFLFVVDQFSKMCVLTPCKKTISSHEVVELLFANIWVPFGLPNSIVLIRTLGLGKLLTTLWDTMETMLKCSTTFHPQPYGQTGVVSRTLVQLLRGYNSKHPKTYDEQVVILSTLTTLQFILPPRNLLLRLILSICHPHILKLFINRRRKTYKKCKKRQRTHAGS